MSVTVSIPNTWYAGKIGTLLGSGEGMSVVRFYGYGTVKVPSALVVEVDTAAEAE